MIKKPSKTKKSENGEAPDLNNWKINFEYRRVFGHNRFYPTDFKGKLLLSAFNRSSFSIDQIKMFREIGFEITMTAIDPLDLLK